MAKARPWKKQKRLKLEEYPSREEVIAIMKSLPSIDLQAYFAITYLTAARISEVLPQKKLRKITYKTSVVTDEAGNSSVKVVRNKNKSPLQAKVEYYEIQYIGVARRNISIIEGPEGNEVMIINLQNRKNRKIKRKPIPVPLELEKEFTKVIQTYIAPLEYNAPLFKHLSQHKVRRVLEEKMGSNPHFLRDIRLFHMVTLYGYNEYQLTRFAGWTDSRPAQAYVRLGTTDLLGGAYQ